LEHQTRAASTVAGAAESARVPAGAQLSPLTSDWSRSRSPAAAPLVRVDAQGQAGVGVPELAHHVGRIVAEGDEDGREGSP